jgi:hypothetical protein
MNIPTAPPVGNGEYNRDVTTIVPAGAELVNSTAPKEFGVANKLTQMSSKDFASRGDNVNVFAGCDPNRYVAVTFTLAAYDVLKTRTSEINGANPCTDAAAGNVTVSARPAIDETARRIATKATFSKEIRLSVMSVALTGRTLAAFGRTPAPLTFAKDSPYLPLSPTLTTYNSGPP